jgi:hypothetical protein
MTYLRTSAFRFLILIFLAPSALAACSSEAPKGHSGKHELTRRGNLPRIEKLSAIKAKMCLCQMAERDVLALSSQYERLTRDLKSESEATGSTPFQYTTTCFPELAPTACLAGPIYYDGGFVCTEAQEKELEHLLLDAMSSDDIERRKATASFQSKLQAMKAKLANSLPQSSCNGL